ncbi:POLAc domain-containing protein [Aphelenchoides bicaudatus]|nr:POLAc domain-containing protein [Aphelenchoides bicaudatus]
MFWKSSAIAEKKIYKIGENEPSSELNQDFNIISDKNAVIGLTVEALAEDKSDFQTTTAFTIEKLYRQGHIKVIACTTTLSTGVNLPAARVLINSIQGPMNVNFIGYNQMIGRCGRLGYGAGQSFVIAQNRQQLAAVWKLIQKRSFNRIERDFTQLILDAVVSKLVKTEEDCERLVNMAIQTPSICAKNIVAYLIDQNFVCTHTTDENTTILIANQLSIAASQSFLRPADAIYICLELEKAAKSICLDTELHLAYLITPLKHKMGIDIKNISWHKFYLALILMEALQGVPVVQILHKYDFKMADLEVLRDQAVLYGRAVVGMCDCLAWSYLKNILHLFSKKLELWAHPDICDLMKIKGMDGTRARSFIERGITTAQELAIAELATVERILRQTLPFLIDSNNSGDKNEWLLNEQLESCADAAQLLIERAQLLAPVQQMTSSFVTPNKTTSSGHSVYNSTRQSFSESLNESDAMNQMDQNIDVTMNSVAEMTAELSMIEFENDENNEIQTTNCVNNFLSKCEFVVFEFVDNQFILMPDNESKHFAIPMNPSKKCQNGCCTSKEMIESFLFDKNVQKYAYNLSLTFYKASYLLGRLEVRNNMNVYNMVEFYCILSLIRVRLTKCPHTFDLLDAEVKRWANSFLTKEEHANQLIAMCRLIKRVLLNQNSSLKPFDEFAQHYNDSVLTSTLMSQRGFTFDHLQYQKLIKYTMKEIVVAEKSVWQLAGEQFNLHNCRATRQVLDKLKIASTGKPTITIGELEQIRHPIAPLIIRARRLNHANKVLRSVQALVNSDNKIRPHYNCLNSSTGRIFAEEPQIQFVPKERYLNGESCRSVFCASPGKILLALDFKQVELRMLAALSNDKQLCELLKNDMDPFEHIVTSYPLERDHKKKIFYALLYGMQKKSLAQELKCTVEEADRVINDIFQYFHGVRAWIEDVAAEASNKGSVQSAWNLSISMHNLSDFEIRQKAPHFIIQASVSEMIRKLMNDIEREFNDDAQLLLQMHDEFILEVRKNNECAHLIKERMEFRVNGIHFPVKIRSGPNWDALE